MILFFCQAIRTPTMTTEVTQGLSVLAGLVSVKVFHPSFVMNVSSVFSFNVVLLYESKHCISPAVQSVSPDQSLFEHLVLPIPAGPDYSSATVQIMRRILVYGSAQSDVVFLVTINTVATSVLISR